jgi:hypothetical protein
MTEPLRNVGAIQKVHGLSWHGSGPIATTNYPASSSSAADGVERDTGAQIIPSSKETCQHRRHGPRHFIHDPLPPLSKSCFCWCLVGL